MSEDPNTAPPQLWWGIVPHAKAKRAWGARALYNPQGRQPLEFLPDRQSYMGTQIDKKQFKRLMTALKKEVLRVRLSKGSTQTLTVRMEGGWRIECSPKGSAGYMYCTAYELDLADITGED